MVVVMKWTYQVVDPQATFGDGDAGGQGSDEAGCVYGETADVLVFTYT